VPSSPNCCRWRLPSPPTSAWGHACWCPQFHTRLYLHCAIVKAGGNPEGYFSRGLTSGDTDEGIESVADREAAAVLVDTASWAVFQERKPGRAKRLRVLDRSRPFPTAVVLYPPQSWVDKELKQLQAALFAAHEGAFTRQILNFWRISKFVPYSAEYKRVVDDILLDIPKPVSPAKFAKE
jgi:ABC-type phosphate/phosphonate transport system substrate-binding protein